MKATFDLPEELIREMKMRAVRQGKKLREVAAEVVRRGLAAPSPLRVEGGRRRVALPIIPKPEGSEQFELSGERLLELEVEAELPAP